MPQIGRIAATEGAVRAEGNHLTVRVSTRYTMLDINGVTYYFHSETGIYDGWSKTVNPDFE